MLRRKRTWAMLAGLIGVVVLPLWAQDGGAAAQVQEIQTRMTQDPSNAWDEALNLQALGEDAAYAIAQSLEQTTGATKLASAKALLVMDGADEQHAAAVRAVTEVLLDADASTELRVLGAELLQRHARASEVRPLRRHVDEVADPRVKIALLKTLRIRGRDRRAEESLRDYLESDDPALRAEAALAIGEMGNVALVQEQLTQLRDEPTDRGRRAATLLDMEDLLSKVERYGGLEETNEILEQRNRRIQDLEAENERLLRQLRSGVAEGDVDGLPGGSLLGEMFELIQQNYVDGEKVGEEDLIDAAAAGLADHLDPFSSYMSRETLSDFNQGIRQQYGGIGAVVQTDRRTGYLTIQRPIYGNPAYEAGLRTLDKIIEIEGTSTEGKTVQELVEILKGVPNTNVELIVETFLTGERRTVSVTRQQITLRSVASDMLPGQIGYVQLTQFGAFATREVEEALQGLEARGMRGLIFDLRGNPGGLLSGAVLVADKFLRDDQLVVYAEGREGTNYGLRQDDGGDRVVRQRRMQPQHPDYPVIVLIDQYSASASEIVSGALQAHGRAELLGQQTFGKGSVQNIFPLESADNKAALRMTIAYYYLPDGRLIHRDRDVESWRFMERMRLEIRRWQQDGLLNETEAQELLDSYQPAPGGVEPDFAVPATKIPEDKQRAYGQVLELQLIEAYIQAHWLEHREQFHQLAVDDGFDPTRYPDFDALWTDVQNGLDQSAREVIEQEDLRKLLRMSVRRFAQDDLERVLTSDYQEDRQLQAALLRMAERTEQSISDLPELAFIQARFPEGVERTRDPDADDDDGDGRDF